MNTRIAAVLLSVPILAIAGCGDAYAPASAEASSPPDVPTASPLAADQPATPATSATPADTVRQMTALAEAGDWVAYVEQFYGEQHKFRPGQDDLQKVADMLAKRADLVVKSLQQVSTVEPVLTADGQQAVFDLGEGQQFTLYRTEDGRWTFHL